jgi:hypothetical protein
MAQTELNVETQVVGLGKISEVARGLSSKKIPAQFTNASVSDSVRSTIDGRAFWLAQVSEAARNFAATQAYEPPGGSTGRKGTSISSVSLVPARNRSLGPNVSSRGSGQCYLRSKSSTLAVLGGLVGIISAVAIADIIPIGQFSDFWRQRPNHRTELASWLASAIPAASPLETELASAFLIVQPRPEVSGKPAPLGLTLEGKLDGAVVTLTGLLPGMELSNGERIGADAWRLTATDLDDVWVGPPDGFVGSIEIIAELRSPNDKVIDRQTVHLEWLPSTSLGLARQSDREEIMPEQRKPEARSFVPPSAEVSDLVRTYGITRDQARRLINKIGKNRAKLDEAARILKTRVLPEPRTVDRSARRQDDIR